jgi:hypothetical protein
LLTDLAAILRAARRRGAGVVGPPAAQGEANMNEHETDESRRKILAALLAAPAAALAGCSADGGIGGELIATEAEALTVPELQTLCNNFYAMTNILEIRIVMPAAEWQALRLEQPKGNNCNFEYLPTAPDRFDWHLATSVTITGSSVPSTSTTFTNIGIKKKSHCGSFDTNKPSFKLDFSEFDNHKAELEALIGTSHLTLHNCKQDESYIRQPLSYYLFKQAGLPYSRCNFCKVFVNDALLGVFVNVEPVRERFIENNFNPNRGGNLYEFELGDDFDANRIQYIDTEKVSTITNQLDLSVAATEVSSRNLARITRVIDLGQFIRFHAMEFLLKHWDSYNGGVNGRGNNTYVYNDVQAVPNPSANGSPRNVWFKFIPSGTDQILQPWQNFGVFNPTKTSLVGEIVRGDSSPFGLFWVLRSQIKTYGDTVFSRTNIDGPINQFIDQMRSILQSMGATAFLGGTTAAVLADIAVVQQQLGLVRSAAFLMGGFPTSSLYIKDAITGDVMRASLTQHVGSSTGTDFEVVHRSFIQDANDRWFASGFPRFVNEGNGGWLHCSGTIRTPANHLMVYTTRTDDGIGAKDFFVIPETINSFCITGACTLLNNRTRLFLKFGTDDATPAATQAQRVYQTGPTTATKVVFY